MKLPTFEIWLQYIKTMTQQTTAKTENFHFSTSKFNLTSKDEKTFFVQKIKFVVGSNIHRINEYLTHHTEVDSETLDTHSTPVVFHVIPGNEIIICLNRFEIMEIIINMAKIEPSSITDFSISELLELHLDEVAEKIVEIIFQKKQKHLKK